MEFFSQNYLFLLKHIKTVIVAIKQLENMAYGFFKDFHIFSIF